ncbi:MAG: hypothetical protein ACYSWU_11990 [Planctomycetota bacterium]|jgi:hypothetical protein
MSNGMRLVLITLLLALSHQTAHAALLKPVTVTNEAGNPVLVEKAVGREPFMHLGQALDLSAPASRSGRNIDVLRVPADSFLVIETVSARVRFDPTSTSAGPVDIVNVDVRFREEESTVINGVLMIPTSTSMLPADPLRGLSTSTTSSGTESVRVVLSPGSLISWGFTVVGNTSSRGTALLNLFGYLVPADSARFDR